MYIYTKYMCMMTKKQEFFGIKPILLAAPNDQQGHFFCSVCRLWRVNIVYDANKAGVKPISLAAPNDQQVHSFCSVCRMCMTPVKQEIASSA